jgi:Zn2+/Cd2+-exporting ATPase
VSEHDHDHAEGWDLALTILCWIGLAVASFDTFVLPLAPTLVSAALWLAFLAGGVPAARSALVELWRDHRLDIDLLMVVAALAAAAVGAALEGAVLLALFSLSQTLEHRAMGKARRAVEALMQLRPETALREGPDGVTEVPVADLQPR